MVQILKYQKLYPFSLEKMVKKKMVKSLDHMKHLADQRDRNKKLNGLIYKQS